MKTQSLALILLAASVSALGVAGTFDFPPVFVWNASASAPIGLYRIERRAPRLGDLALVEPEERLETFIVERGYLPEDVPLLKRVAALSGSEVCRDAESIFIDGNHVAEAHRSDSAGRVMPVWRGCFTLSDEEILLLSLHPNSLDGRYFGATKIDQVIGIAIPVWTSESDE